VEGELLVRREAQAGVAASEFGHGDLGFQLAQVRAQAEVQALAERQVPVGVGAVQVKFIGPVERGGVPAGRGQPEEQLGASRDRHAPPA